MAEVMPRIAEVEAEVHHLVEAHMETLLGVRFLASEYVIDCLGGGRIDLLGLDENGAPVVAEPERGTDAGVINQGLYCAAWLTNHRMPSGTWSATGSERRGHPRSCGAHRG